MKFAYSSIVSAVPATGEYVLLRRPEIPITIVGPDGSATFVALVDTGSDNTIFPKSVADLLGISLSEDHSSAAGVFGGGRVQLFEGEATLRLEDESESLDWPVVACFYGFTSDDEETVVLGHSGFLDYFAATFDGKLGELTLIPNDELPIATPD